MPAAKEHFAVGVLAAGLVNGLAQLAHDAEDPDQRFDWGELVLSCLAGGAVALLPDILEPADSPCHRRFFHSAAAAGLVAYAVSGRHVNRLSPETRRFLWVLAASYSSHTLMDSGTPKSVPMIGVFG